MPVLATNAESVDTSLRDQLLNRWFPACIAAHGEGFHQDFSRDWSPIGYGDRFIVFQSRMTWLCATVAEHAGNAATPQFDWAEPYRAWADMGSRYLRSAMLNEDGSTRWYRAQRTADDANSRESRHRHERHAYGHAFAIYAFAAAARALDCEPSLNAAIGVFEYLESAHFDREFGGYWEVSDANGRPIITGTGVDGIGTAYGVKSQNTHLHLLEAYADLVRVSPDVRVRRRLAELIDIFLDPLFVADGWLHIYATADWQGIPGPVSHGHDVEAAHLVLDAARLIDHRVAEAEEEAVRLIDYALQVGWHDAGGFFYTGNPAGEVIDTTKNWWAQAEGLLGLATVADLTGAVRYDAALDAQWRWIRDHQIDAEHGGWWESVAPDGTPLPPTTKGHAWKAAYHDGRALLFTSRILRRRGQ